MRELFTIGHSNHTWDRFLELLRWHRIDALGDVRSRPYSTRLPQFNRELIERGLRVAAIRYVFLGDELGARRSERECYVDGVARYDLIIRSPAFQAGLARVKTGIQRFRLALMCAEKDPLECHRAILVCRHLRDGAQIRHILADGNLEFHTDAEARLLIEERVPADDFFATRDVLLTRAYDQRAEKIAYHESAEPVPPA